MAKVTFSRTSSWDGGWRGKQNSTAILVDGERVGAILGSANTATPGAMNYRVQGVAISVAGLSLAEAKQRVRSALEA